MKLQCEYFLTAGVFPTDCSVSFHLGVELLQGVTVSAVLAVLASVAWLVGFWLSSLPPSPPASPANVNSCLEVSSHLPIHPGQMQRRCPENPSLES